jgi:hypothetical protein
LNDGRTQNPSNPFEIVPLFNFAPRGFGFVHHSIAILYHEVPNPNLTIRNFFYRSTADEEDGEELAEALELAAAAVTSYLVAALQGNALQAHAGALEEGTGTPAAAYPRVLRGVERAVRVGSNCTALSLRVKVKVRVRVRVRARAPRPRHTLACCAAWSGPCGWVPT